MDKEHNKKKLFGTDGIRGRVNLFPMLPETVVNIGRAIAIQLGKGKIIIARDTRLSGEIFEHAISAGIACTGTDAAFAGILPTSGLAFITKDYRAAAGIVITASHNPHYYNGIKIFNHQGIKLDDNEEYKIDVMARNRELYSKYADVNPVGKYFKINDAEERYIDFLKGAAQPGDIFKGLKIVIDCSNGALSNICPRLFSELGCKVIAIFCKPDGININLNCGSEHPEALCKAVINEGADIGLAFDGDGDRVIGVDEKGNILNGDHILFILARYMKKQGILKNNIVVSTIMSNIGLSKALNNLGIKVEKSKVGDRYVAEKMIGTGAILGGEDSGHTIMFDHHTTGDGVLTGIKLIIAMVSESKPLSELAGLLSFFPRVFTSVKVKEKPDLHTLEYLQKAIKEAESKIGKDGRVLVRYSGTEPVCRVLVEGADINTLRECSESILFSINKEFIGAGA